MSFGELPCTLCGCYHANLLCPSLTAPRPTFIGPSTPIAFPFVEPASAPAEPSPADLIIAECDAIKAMLLAKNAAYGNSALAPLRIFSQASPEEQILVRIDDKLSRLKRGASAGEDVVQDLIGYLVLLRIVRRGAP